MLSVVNLVAETSLVGSVALLAARAMSPRKSVLIWRFAVVVLLLAPLSMVASGSSRGLIEFRIHNATDTTVEEHAARLELRPSGGFASLTADPRTGVATVLTPMLALAVFWAVGAILLLGRYLVSLRYLSRTFAGGRRLAIADESVSRLRKELEIEAAPTIRIVGNIATSCTFGWLRPKVLVPSRIFEDAASFEPILAHELCHIRNQDAFWLMLCQLACSIYWFNPLFWLGARAHRRAMELVCDDDATESVIAIDDYITALLGAARRIGSPLRVAPGGVMMNGHDLTARVRFLIDRRTSMPKVSVGTKVLLFMLTAGVLAALGSMRLVDAEEIAIPQQATAMVEDGYAALPRILTETRLGPNEAKLYVDAGDGVTVRSSNTRWMCREGTCEFTVPANRNVTLIATADAKLAWSGCKVSEDGRQCSVHVARDAVHVVVLTRRD